MTEIGFFPAALSSFLGTLGFAVLVHAPKRALLPASLSGMAAFLIAWLLAHLGVSEAAAIFCGSLAGSLTGLSLARHLRMIGTVYLMMSIVSFVPGLGLYRCMEYFGAGEARLGAETLIQAMITIVMIVMGQALGSFIDRALHTRQRRKPAA